MKFSWYTFGGATAT